MSELRKHSRSKHETGEASGTKPKRTALGDAAWAVGRTAALIVLAGLAGCGARTGAADDAAEAEALARRIQPVGAVTIGETTAPSGPRTGEQVYQMQCSACHAIGAAGSPKFGDAAAWGPRIKTGFDALLNSALKGKNAMTPQGGGQFSELEVGRALVYMANQAGAKFEEPKAPAAPASAAK